MAARPADAFAAGAARAAGERAKRTRTPLLGAAAPVQASGTPGSSARASGTPGPSAARPAGMPPTVPDPSTPPPPRPRRATTASPRGRPTRRRGGTAPDQAPAAKPTLATGSAPERTPAARSAAKPTPATGSALSAPAPPARSAPERPVRRTAYPPLVPLPEGPKISDSVLAAALTRQELTPDLEDLLAALIGTLRTLAAASGKGPDEVEQAVARTLAFLSRRLSGSYEVDDFGFDADWTEHVILPLLRVIYRQWFRVEVRGIEHVPAQGSALIVANHSGTIAWDAMMAQVAVHDEHPAHRYLRLLGGDLVFKTPLLGTLSRQTGTTLATNYDAERLLTRGELVGVFPEGYKGVGKPFSERYKLQRFGRGGFVGAAVRAGAPIVPLAIVGAEETYPLIGNVPALARLLNTPYFPITPTFPWLGPMGMIPLPSKWIMEFGEPIRTDHLGPSVAEDPMLTFDLTDQVRETIQQTLYTLLMLRRSAFS